jgi:hypothetical protein
MSMISCSSATPNNGSHVIRAIARSLHPTFTLLWLAYAELIKPVLTMLIVSYATNTIDANVYLFNVTIRMIPKYLNLFLYFFCFERIINYKHLLPPLLDQII